MRSGKRFTPSVRRFPSVAFETVPMLLVLTIVDDFTLCIQGNSVQRVERAMQLCVNSTTFDFRKLYVCTFAGRHNGVFRPNLLSYWTNLISKLSKKQHSLSETYL